MSPEVAPDAAPAAPLVAGARLRPLVALLAVVVAALLAFTVAATGSIGAAAALVASALHLAGFVHLLAARRRVPGAPDPARPFLAGMGLTAAGLLGAVALAQVFSPQGVTLGGVGVVALVLASALSLIGATAPALRSPPGSGDPEAVADPSVVLVAAIGLASAAFLGAPGLDAAAALIIALWLAWGALEDLRTGAR